MNENQHNYKQSQNIDAVMNRAQLAEYGMSGVRKVSIDPSIDACLVD